MGARCDRTFQYRNDFWSRIKVHRLSCDEALPGGAQNGSQIPFMVGKGEGAQEPTQIKSKFFSVVEVLLKNF